MKDMLQNSLMWILINSLFRFPLIIISGNLNKELHARVMHLKYRDFFTILLLPDIGTQFKKK